MDDARNWPGGAMRDRRERNSAARANELISRYYSAHGAPGDQAEDGDGSEASWRSSSAGSGAGPRMRRPSTRPPARVTRSAAARLRSLKPEEAAPPPPEQAAVLEEEEESPKFEKDREEAPLTQLIRRALDEGAYKSTGVQTDDHEDDDEAPGVLTEDWGEAAAGRGECSPSKKLREEDGGNGGSEKQEYKVKPELLPASPEGSPFMKSTAGTKRGQSQKEELLTNSRASPADPAADAAALSKASKLCTRALTVSKSSEATRRLRSWASKQRELERDMAGDDPDQEDEAHFSAPTPDDPGALASNGCGNCNCGGSENGSDEVSCGVQ